MRKHIKSIIGLLAIAAFTVSANAQDTVKPITPSDTLKLNLDQCLEVALSENISIRVSEYEIEKKTYAKKGAYSSLYPQIGISGAYQKTLKKQTMYMDMGGQTTAITVGMNNTWNATMSAAMPLVNPQLWKSLQISDLDIDLAVEQSRSSKLEMIYTVTQSFYTVLLASKSYEILNTALSNARNNYENVKHRYEIGLSSEYDMLRSSVEVASYEPQVLNAQNSIELAKWQLKAVIGIDLEIPIFCVGDLDDYKDTIHVPFEKDFSLDNNTSLRQLNIQMEQVENSIKMYKRAYIPTLALAFSYQYYAMNNTLDFSKYKWTPYSTASLALDIPVFSGMKRLNDVRQAKTQKTQLSLQKENVERELYVAAKQVISSMETCVKQYDAAETSVDQAVRGYQIASKRYDTGKGTILEVNDSRLAAIQAKLNLDQAIYEYLVAKASLDKIIGSALIF